jgi:hypothetical protein
MSRHGRKPPEMTPDRAKEVLRRAGRVSEAPEPPDPSAALAAANLPPPDDPVANLPYRQGLLLINLVKGMTQAEAAAASGLTYAYVRQLLLNESFRAAIARTVAEMREDAVRDARAMVGLAIRRQRDLLIDPTTPPVVVAQVVRDVLDRFGIVEPKAADTVKTEPLSDAEASKAITSAATLPDLPDAVER